MKLPKFLTINPDFKKAVDAYPEKDKIRVETYWGTALVSFVTFGDGICQRYFDPTWAERRYARKASATICKYKININVRQNKKRWTENNQKVCREIIEQAEWVGRA